MDIKENLRRAYGAKVEEREAKGLERRAWQLRSRELFLEDLRHRQVRTLLDIGCGTGTDAAFFAAEGFEVVATDLSPAYVARCVEKGLTAYERDCYDLGFARASFDGVWCRNVLLHVPDSDLPGVLQGIADVLADRGLFYLGLWGGEDVEGIWEHDNYEPKRFYSRRTDDQVRQAVAPWFEVLRFDVDDIPHLPGHYQCLVLQKR